MRGSLDGVDIDGSSNETEQKKRKRPVAYIPREPEEDAQLQTAIQLLSTLKKAESAGVDAVQEDLPLGNL